MNKCLNCGIETANNKFCSISCQNKFQNTEKSNVKFGLFKEFTVKCERCGKEYIVNEREKLFPQKEKYFCSRSCANKRVLSEETKEKIRKTLTKNDTVKIVYKQCNKECETTFKNNNKTIKPKIKIKKEKDINKITFIYSLEYPIGNIRYIGKSDFPQKRLKDHIKETKQRNKSHKDKWINSLCELPTLKIIEQTTYEHWQNREIYWIKYYKDKGFNLVNGTDGGEGSNGFKGKTHTKENIEKFASKLRGRIQPQEIKDKVSGENNGRCKLKDNDIREIFNMFFNEYKTPKEISEKYNVNEKYVYHLISGRKRKNIFNEFNNITH